MCCDITSTIRRLYDPHSKVYEALRAENSRRFKELWASKSPEERAAWCSAISKGVSLRSRAPFNDFTCLEHMDVRAGMKAHHASPAGAVARDKEFKSKRDAKKKAFFATMDEQALAARALEEQAPIEQREKELLELRRRVDERAEARAAEKQARAEALALAARAATAPLTEAETAALRAGGRAADLVQRNVAARARDAALLTEGKAAKVLERQNVREYSTNYRKQKKAKGEGLVQEEARLMERATGLLVHLERGGSTVLDDDGAGAFPEDEEAIKALVAAKENEKDKKKRKALGMRETRARQALAAKALQRRVGLLEIRVAKLEEEMRAQAAA